MKKMILTLVTMLTMALTSNAMSYEQARSEALFLTDKMAYELNLSDAQYEAAYEINLDYLMSITSYDDVAGIWWERRNQDLRYILYSWQWDAFCAATYFYRPLYWEAGYWHFGVYARYPRRDYFYFGTPHFYVSYRGGHSWHMNGGRSYYEHRRDHFRPGHVERSHHVGMRTSWDRGDYRGRTHGNSSTRVTAGGHSGRVTNGERRGDRTMHISTETNGHRNGSREGMGNRPNNSTREGMGNRQNNGSREGMGTRTNPSRNFGGTRDNSSRPSPSSSIGSSTGTRHSMGSSSSTPSRSYGGSSSAPSRSFGSSHSSTSSHSSGGSFSGSRGSSHSMGGGHSGGGPTRGGGSGGGRSGSSRR